MKQKFRRGDKVVSLYYDNIDSRTEVIDVIKQDDFIYLVKDKDGILQGFRDNELGLISRGYEWKMVQQLLKEIAVDFADEAFPEDVSLKLPAIIKVLKNHGYEDENIF